MGGCELCLFDPGQGQVAGFCKHSNEPWSSIKMWEISLLAEGPVVLQEGLCCMEFISWLAVAVAGYLHFIFSISVL